MSDKAKPNAKQPNAKKNGVLGWLITALPIMLGLGLFYSPLLMLLVLMLPGWFALLSDNEDEHALGVCVGSGTLAGAMFSVAPYLLHVPPLETAFILLQQPQTWICALGGAGAGAFLYYLTPMLMVEGLYVRNQIHLKELETAQKKLIDEWGEDIHGS